MNTAARAWQAFMSALAETRELHKHGADAATIADLLRHARELLDIIEDEIATQAGSPTDDARAALVQLRARIESLELDVMPIRH